MTPSQMTDEDLWVVVMWDARRCEERPNRDDCVNELLRRQKQRHLDLIAAYAAEMEAVNGTLNGGPYSEGASLAARHILNLIKECK